MKNKYIYIFILIVLCLYLSFQMSGGAMENTAIVTIDGKDYSYTQAENLLISMFRSGDRDKEKKAKDFLMHSPAGEQFLWNKKIADAMTEVFKKNPDISSFTIDGKEYNFQETENILISMLRSEDKDKELKAIDFLIRTRSGKLFHESKRIMDAAIDLYKKLPPLYYGFKDENQDANQQIKLGLFTIITASSDPRGKVILEEAIKSENETMRKIGLFAKEELLKRDEFIELQKKGGKKPEPVVINPIILDVSTAKAEDLKVVLSDILATANLTTKIKSIQRLAQQSKYLNSKEGQEKRTIILKLLQDHYKIEEKYAAQEMILGTLSVIGGEDERTFIEEVIKDKKTPRDIRKNAEILIQMLDAERGIQKKKLIK
ncbi:MAG: hypothetical protein PHS54_07330 [Clostridia bacterium]|nr:hypothetical protein [Clostridia bacterium]